MNKIEQFSLNNFEQEDSFEELKTEEKQQLGRLALEAVEALL